MVYVNTFKSEYKLNYLIDVTNLFRYLIYSICMSIKELIEQTNGLFLVCDQITVN